MNNPKPGTRLGVLTRIEADLRHQITAHNPEDLPGRIALLEKHQRCLLLNIRVRRAILAG